MVKDNDEDELGGGDELLVKVKDDVGDELEDGGMERLEEVPELELVVTTTTN